MGNISDGGPSIEQERFFSEGLKVNDRTIAVLRDLERVYKGYHLVVGGIGVAGVLGQEVRPIEDLDVLVLRPDLEAAKTYFFEQGFEPWSANKVRGRLFGNGGTVLERKQDRFLVDIAIVDREEGGIVNPLGSGKLHIPVSGIDYPVSLRGINFKTFSPEVHWLFKYAATRRHPLHTISPFNRRKDETDLIELEKIINAQKLGAIIKSDFKYEGRHPLLAKIIQEVKLKLFGDK